VFPVPVATSSTTSVGSGAAISTKTAKLGPRRCTGLVAYKAACLLNCSLLEDIRKEFKKYEEYEEFKEMLVVINDS
jgi:hypothetical protein